MASPVSTTTNAAGNLLASGTIVASGNTTYDVDVSAKFEVIIQHSVVFGTVAATAGVQVDVFARVGSGPAIDTQSILTQIVTATTGTQLKSLRLPTGRYRVKLTNLDASNSVTAVTATDDSFDSVA